MNYYKRFLLSMVYICLFMVFSGCAASSFNEMVRDKNYERREYLIKEGYQELYKRSLDKSRECHETGLLTAAIITEGQIYSELDKAELSIYLIGGLGKSMYHGAEFIKKDYNSTNLIIYSKFGGEWFNILKNEFTGECKNCFCKDDDIKIK